MKCMRNKKTPKGKCSCVKCKTKKKTKRQLRQEKVAKKYLD